MHSYQVSNQDMHAKEKGEGEAAFTEAGPNQASE